MSRFCPKQTRKLIKQKPPFCKHSRSQKDDVAFREPPAALRRLQAHNPGAAALLGLPPILIVERSAGLAVRWMDMHGVDPAKPFDFTAQATCKVMVDAPKTDQALLLTQSGHSPVVRYFYSPLF